MLGFLQQLGGQFGAWFYVIAGSLVFAEAAVMAGMARMACLRTFLPWNLAGAVIWGTVLLGYEFSASLAATSRVLTYVPLVVIALAAAALVLVRIRRTRHAAR